MAVLMCKNTPVYETRSKKILNPELMPFASITYETWCKRRAYVSSNLDARSADGLVDNNRFEKKRRFSLSDCYWVRHALDKEATDFESLSPYLNEFTTYNLSTKGSSVPDTTLGGSLNKHWERLSENTAINKFGRDEWIKAEMKALRLCRCLDLSCVDFIEKSDQELLIVNCTDTSQMLMNLSYYGKKPNGYNPREVAEDLTDCGVTGACLDWALKTVLFDMVVGNNDRYTNYSNWGFYKSSDTGKCTLAPLFDFNLAHTEQPNQYLTYISKNLKENELLNDAYKILSGWNDRVKVFDVPVWHNNLMEMIEKIKSL